MARRIGTSTATLHRLETGRLRDGSLVDAYERALGRPTGSLRAPIDVACRTFPTAPVDRNPGTRITTVREVSALTDLVASAPSGGAWLTWARALSRPGAIGLPASLATTLLERLVSELSRSTGHGHATRYEALALLRGSDYGDFVLDVARAWVAEPDVQVLYDLCSAVGESMTPDAVSWCLELLDDSRDRVLVGGVLALENMGQISPSPAVLWRQLVDPISERFNDSGPGSERWDWLSHLIRLVPRALWREGTVPLRHELAPAARIQDWSRTRLNSHWTECEERAHTITAALAIPDQPILARLLFDVAVSHFETRAVTSNLLLGALPHLAGPVATHLADLSEHHADPVLRARSGRRLPGALHGAYLPLIDRWLAGEDADLRDRGLFVAGAAGVVVDDRALETAIADSSTRPAMYAAGMAGHPALTRLAEDQRHDPGIRGAARWWLKTGTRVTD